MKETLTVSLFIVGNLIGAGFFMMPAMVAPLGVNLVWSWISGTVVALIFALIFGKLFVLFPQAETLSDYFECFSLKQTVATLYWIGAIVGNVILLTMTLSVFKPSFITPSLLIIFGCLVMLILTLINHCLTYETVENIEIILSILKFFLLLVLPAVIFLSNPSALKIPKAGGEIKDIAKFGMLSFWAFLGIETAGVFGKGKAARNGLLIGIIACFFLYVFSCFLIVGIVPLELLISGKKIPLVHLVEFSRFSYLAGYVPILISFTCFGALYGWVAATSKMSLSYARSGVFPKVFLLETRSNNSLVGLWLSSTITFIIFILVSSFKMDKQFNIIADFCVNITLFIFCLCAVVLYSVSKTIADKGLSLFGLFSVALLLLMNIQSSLISFALFIITLVISQYLN